MPCLLTPRNYFGLLSLVTESHSQSYYCKVFTKTPNSSNLDFSFSNNEDFEEPTSNRKKAKTPRRKDIKRGRRGEKDAEARKSLYNQTQYGQYCCRKDFLATKGINNLVMVAIMVLAFYFKYYSDMVSYMP